jgi:hypothetical protein
MRSSVSRDLERKVRSTSFLADHSLSEDDGAGNEDAGGLDITGLLEDIDEDMGNPGGRTGRYY